MDKCYNKISNESSSDKDTCSRDGLITKMAKTNNTNDSEICTDYPKPCNWRKVRTERLIK